MATKKKPIKKVHFQVSISEAALRKLAKSDIMQEIGVKSGSDVIKHLFYLPEEDIDVRGSVRITSEKNKS